MNSFFVNFLTNWEEPSILFYQGRLSAPGRRTKLDFLSNDLESLFVTTKKYFSDTFFSRSEPHIILTLIEQVIIKSKSRKLVWLIFAWSIVQCAVSPPISRRSDGKVLIAVPRNFPYMITRQLLDKIFWSLTGVHGEESHSSSGNANFILGTIIWTIISLQEKSELEKAIRNHFNLEFQQISLAKIWLSSSSLKGFSMNKKLFLRCCSTGLRGLHGLSDFNSSGHQRRVWNQNSLGSSSLHLQNSSRCNLSSIRTVLQGPVWT